MNFELSRRSFLKNSLKAGLATCALGAVTNPLGAIEPLNRPGKPRFMLSLAAYSFRDSFVSTEPAGKLDLFQFIDYCADHGCDGTELTSYYFPKNLTQEFLLKIKRHVYLRGMAISGTAVGNNFALPPGEKRNEQIALVKKWIDHSAVMGAPHIRVFAGPIPKSISEAEARGFCISALEECCDYAGSKGVFLGLENHGGIVAEADGLLAIVKAVQSPWIGINLDTGNFHTKDPYGDLERCAPYAVNVQFKVNLRQDGKKKGADFPKLFDMLKRANYQGYVALEYEAAEDPWKAIPELLKQMKQLL
ncbi:MAG: sugar phosphate isomerase/epimerase [Verrucomicrobia bacterium]|nr:sugar phosphate isomerase/epimerase [Verrucomicrobiota bacterium]